MTNTSISTILKIQTQKIYISITQGGDFIKKFFITLGVVFGILFGLIFTITILPWLLLGIGLCLSEAPPEPTIKYNEFPFHLEYTINGETVVVDDTLVCEYTGIELNEAVGKYRTWDSYIKSTGKEYVLITGDETLEWRIYLNDADTLMGDYDTNSFDTETNEDALTKEEIDERLAPNIVPVKIQDVEVGPIDMYEDFTKKYGVKITVWEVAPPITNEFVD